MTHQSQPTIILIGGSSATGKSTLGRNLARRLDVRYIDLDLFWIVLQRAIPAEVQPDLHLLEPDSVWLLPVDELVERYQRVSQAVCSAIEPLIAHHSIIDEPAVIEGCWLLPRFVSQRFYTGRLVDDVRALYLLEPSTTEFARRVATRPGPLPSFFVHNPEAQRNHALMQHQFGLQVKRQAEALNLPIIQSRPFNTLVDRAVAALDLSRSS